MYFLSDCFRVLTTKCWAHKQRKTIFPDLELLKYGQCTSRTVHASEGTQSKGKLVIARSYWELTIQKP